MSNETNLINLEAEQSILGALLNNCDAFDRINSLDASDFEYEFHHHIYKAIQDFAEKGQRFDAVSVFEKTKSKGLDFQYIQSICSKSLSSANVSNHATILHDLSMRRQIARIGYEFTAIAEQALTFEECLDKASSSFDSVANKSKGTDSVKLSDLVGGIYETLQQRLTGKLKRLSTGFSQLDRMTSGGLGRGELILVAGRPAAGKTAMALSIAKNMAKDYSCLFFSMEMPKDQIRDRFVSMLGKVPLSFVIEPTEEDTEVNRKDWAAIVEAQKKSESLHFYIDDRSTRSLLDIRLKSREIQRKNGLDVIFVDYLGLMGGGDKNENRTQQIGSYTRGLKAIAKDLNIAVVCLAQLNRGLEQRPDKRPLLSDLRDSGEVEQDADMVFMLYRDEIYHPETSAQKGIAEVIIRKQRQGITGTVPMAYIGNQVRFETLENHWTPPAYSKPKLVSQGFN